MTIEQQYFAMPLLQGLQGIGKRVMIRPMNLLDSSIKLGVVDRPAPQRPVAMSPGWDQPQTVPGPGSDRLRADAGDSSGVQLLFVAVAVDHCAWHRLDDGAQPGRDRPPCEPVDKRVFQRFQRRPSLGGIGQQSRIIIAARMGH